MVITVSSKYLESHGGTGVKYGVPVGVVSQGGFELRMGQLHCSSVVCCSSVLLGSSSVLLDCRCGDW